MSLGTTIDCYGTAATGTICSTDLARDLGTDSGMSRSLSDAVSAMDDQDVSVGVVHHLGRHRPEDSIGAVITVVSDHDEIDIHGAGDVDNLAPRIAKDDERRAEGDARNGGHPLLQLTMRVGDQLGF